MALDGNFYSEGACYQSKDAKDMATLSLVRQAHRLFAAATSIKYIEEFKDIVSEKFNPNKMLSLNAKLNPSFLDALLIVTAFENVLKAELLAKDFVVHEAAAKSPLKPIQEKTPLAVSQLITEEGTNWQASGKFTIKSLSKKTLTISRIVGEPHYQTELSLKKDEVEALQRAIHHRNKVHLFINDSRSFSNQVIADLELLKSLINRIAIPRCNATLQQISHLSDRDDMKLTEI